MSENNTPDQDTCRPVEIDGETIRVRGQGELTQEGQEALTALVRAAKAKFVAEAPQQVGGLQNRLRLAHKARRAKEHQLDGIRRALCDAGFMEDDDPYSHADLEDVIRQVGEVDRKEMAALRAEVAAARTFAAEMREFCSPHGVATDYADRLLDAMDRAKGEHRDPAADTLAAEWHRRYQRLEDLSRDPDTPATVLEHVRGELVGLRGALGVLLGGQVEGGTADLLGWSYYQEWRRQQEVQA